MKTSGPEEQRSFSFDTEKEGDIANLISSYSPVHSNWKRVGEAKTRLIRVTEEDHTKLWQDIWNCRRALAIEHKMLQKPPETGNFLTTTLLDTTDRVEIFCRLIRQVTDNPKEEAVLRGWHFLTLCTTAFPPSKNFNRFVQVFYQTHSSDAVIGRYSAACLHTMRLTKVSAKKYSCSSMEIAAVKNLNPLICRFYFLDGERVNPSATASDVIRALAEKIELQNVDGWVLCEVNPEKEHFIKGHEYVADVLSQWEKDKRSSVTMTKYTTVSHKPSYTAALRGGDSKFVFNKRVFRRPKEILEDPVEYHLMCAQAVHSIVKIDECPVNEAADGFCLFEVFGQLERNMLPREKVADAMFRSSGRNARSTHSPKILKLTFKKRL